MSTNGSLLPDQAIELVNQVKTGVVAAKSLTKDQRQVCVGYLLLKGLEPSEIAKILDCSDRTIRRDREDIRDRNAMYPDPKLVGQIVGELSVNADFIFSNLKKIAADKKATITERTNALNGAWKVQFDVVKLYQSLGYLPNVPNQSLIDVYHHQGDDLEQHSNGLLLDVKNLIGDETLNDDDRQELLAIEAQLKTACDAASAANKIEEFKQQREDMHHDC